MFPRTALLGFALVLAPACKEGSSDNNDSGAASDGTDGTDGTDGADGADGADGTDGTDGTDSLVGRWERDEPFDLEEGLMGDLAWTGSDDGSCEVELQTDEFTEAFACTYTAEAGDFTMQDDGCPGDVGRYTYSVSGDALTFTLVDDPCEDRVVALSSSWTRAD